jgi:16S rRNA U516 pseudouridylate synthase RsuA-like enzyme
MLKALGYLVENLERKSFAGITVKGIPKGSYMILSNYDINGVYKKYA